MVQVRWNLGWNEKPQSRPIMQDRQRSRGDPIVKM